MKLETENSSYTFHPDRYEDRDLGEIDATVRVIPEAETMMDAVRGTGSCLMLEEPFDYLREYEKSEHVHFYGLDPDGYARSVELPTSEGEVLAVDVIKMEDFDPETFRSAVNAIFRHADSMKLNGVLGGKGSFKYAPNVPLDLTYEDNHTTRASEVYFGGLEDIEVATDEKVKDKGENWGMHDKFFFRKL
jgi:hypothetical protein